MKGNPDIILTQNTELLTKHQTIAITAKTYMFLSCQFNKQVQLDIIRIPLGNTNLMTNKSNVIYLIQSNIHL